MVDEQDRVLGTQSFASTRQGYRQMLAWMRSFGDVQRVGVGSTDSYGAGLLRFLQQAGVTVLEVTTPDRQDRRRRGKNDDFDAQNAAHAAFAGIRTVTPKSRDGMIEALRVLSACRKTAVAARRIALQMIQNTIVCAPESLREMLRRMTRMQLVRTLAAWRPDLTAYRDMEVAVSPVSGRRYGLATVCRVWRLARSGVYRPLTPPPATPPGRRGPVGAMPDGALLAAIRAVLTASPFYGEGPRKVWARLRAAGTRTSLRRVLRLMRENELLAPTRVGSARGPRAHDGTIIPETVDAMWGTDLTTTWTEEGPAAVFIAVDHASAACVGIHAAARATRFEALEPIRQGMRRHFGGMTRDSARGLAVRHDHGSQYMSDHFQKELAFLGVDSSPAFVRAPEGNGGAERFIRTLKENLLWVRTFGTVEELRQALLAFRETYNETWLIKRHGFLSPADYHRRQLQPLAQAA